MELQVHHFVTVKAEAQTPHVVCAPAGSLFACMPLVNESFSGQSGSYTDLLQRSLLVPAECNSEVAKLAGNLAE